MAEELIFSGAVTATASTPAIPADSWSTVEADISITGINGGASYVFQLQKSPDGGTTWFNVGAASAAQTANGNVEVTSGVGVFTGTHARLLYTNSAAGGANLAIWVDGK